MMGLGNVARTLLAATGAFSLVASAASGQVVTYSTVGTFSGGTGGTVCSSASCTAGGFTLSFSNASTASYLGPTLVDLGQFVTEFSPAGGSSGLVAFNGVSFALGITQTAPTAGSAGFSGAIAGSLAYNPSTSTLVWTPTLTATSIGPVTYRLVVDNTGNINIQAPTTATGNNPNSSSVKGNINVASVTVTPEPATALLLAPSLVGLGILARARRRRD